MGIKVNQETLQMIADLSNARGASGFEDETVQAAAKHIGEGYTTEEDCLRNFYMYRTANSGNKPVFMLDAHSDEVGFMVHSIRPNGTLRFVALGGWNVGSLASSKVLVRNSEGKYLPGVIAAKPVHFMSASEKASAGAADISSLSIDIGAVSAKDAAENFKIRIGEPVVPDVTLEYDEEHDLMFGKAFDCRIGCAALIETLRRLRDEKLDVDVVGVLSSQEEVGERGMKVAVNLIKPQIAICFEAVRRTIRLLSLTQSRRPSKKDPCCASWTNPSSALPDTSAMPWIWLRSAVLWPRRLSGRAAATTVPLSIRP